MQETNRGIERRDRRYSIVRFVFVLGVLMGAFYGLMPFIQKTGIVDAFLNWNARASAVVLASLGHRAKANEASVSTSRFSFEIRRGCDASEPIFLFVAAIVAFRARWRWKVVGTLLGSSMLIVANLVRIITLYFTGVYWPKAFEVMHVDVWQALFVVLTVALWVAWAIWSMRGERCVERSGTASG